MTLEGIQDHAAMRDFLYSRMRGARHLDGVSPATTAADPLAAILTEIAGELRAIREGMASRP
jgi:hypothetical protein